MEVYVFFLGALTFIESMFKAVHACRDYSDLLLGLEYVMGMSGGIHLLTKALS